MTLTLLGEGLTTALSVARALTNHPTVRSFQTGTILSTFVLGHPP